MYAVRQNTNNVRLPAGPVIDPTDGKTAITTYTGTPQIFKPDGSMAAATGTVTITHKALGVFDVLFASGANFDLHGMSKVVLPGQASHGPIPINVMVMNQQVFDALYGTDKIQVDLVESSGITLATVTDILSTAVPGSFPAGSLGKAVGDSLDGSVGDVLTDLSTVLSRLPPLVGGRVDVNLSAAGLEAGAAQEIVDALLAQVMETGSGAYSLTFARYMRIMFAALAAIASGMDTAVGRFLSADGSKTRVQANLDGNGNRTGVTWDGD